MVVEPIHDKIIVAEPMLFLRVAALNRLQKDNEAADAAGTRVSCPYGLVTANLMIIDHLSWLLGGQLGGPYKPGPYKRMKVCRCEAFQRLFS